MYIQYCVIINNIIIEARGDPKAIGYFMASGERLEAKLEPF